MQKDELKKNIAKEAISKYCDQLLHCISQLKSKIILSPVKNILKGGLADELDKYHASMKVIIQLTPFKI